MSEQDTNPGIPRLYIAYRIVAPLLMLMMMAGFFASLLRWKPGAYLLVVDVPTQVVNG